MPDQMIDTQPTVDTTTAPQGSGAPAAPAQGTGSEPAWAADPKFKGKDPNHIYQSYKELEKKLGRLPELEQELGQWRQFHQGWDPYLRQFGYSPERLAQALEAVAQRRQAAGDTAGAQQAHQAARRAWAEALTPDDQQKWIEGYVGEQLGGTTKQVAQVLQQLQAELRDYVNRYGDLALRAIEKKFQHPNLSIGDLLQEAVRISTNQYDPLEWAARIKSAPSEDELRERLRRELREELKAEQQNASMTTMVGAGGARGSRALRPNTPAPQAAAAAARRPGGAEAARDRFMKNWSQIAGDTAE